MLVHTTHVWSQKSLVFWNCDLIKFSRCQEPMAWICEHLGTSSSTFLGSSRPEAGAVLGTTALRKRACRISLQLCSNGLGKSLQVTHSNNASSSTSYASCLNSVIGTVHVSQLEPGVQIVEPGNGWNHQKSHCCQQNAVPKFQVRSSKTRAICGTLFWIFQCNI